MPSTVKILEQEFARAQGLGHAVATGFGRSALFLALQTLATDTGDILVPDLVCSQVTAAVRRAGHRPVFFRIPRDLTCAPAAFEQAWTAMTRGVVVLHYFGRVQPHIAALAMQCRARGVPLIEDCALALGATHPEASGRDQPAGSWGEGAVFSLTKSDWGYGGGMVTCRSEEWRRQMREYRDRRFRTAAWLPFAYGLLRRADFAGNKPSRGAWVERAGRVMESAVRAVPGFSGSARDTSTGNFYDAAPFDTLLPPFAARRARRVLRRLPEASACRRDILFSLTRSLRDVPGLLLRSEAAPGDAGTFLPLASPSGHAESWRDVAAREGVTLRLCWPAYQPADSGLPGGPLDWFARHLLWMEIHERLTAREISKITSVISRLAEMDSKHSDA